MKKLLLLSFSLISLFIIIAIIYNFEATVLLACDRNVIYPYNPETDSTFQGKMKMTNYILTQMGTTTPKLYSVWHNGTAHSESSVFHKGCVYERISPWNFR